jgi:hypothetical protein
MENRYTYKMSWLAYVNLGLGFLAFSSGLVPLATLVSAILGWDVTAAPVIGPLTLKYFDGIGGKNFYAISITGIIFGIATLIIGFIASISITEKKQRGIAFLGNILGILGLIGLTAILIAVLNM